MDEISVCKNSGVFFHVRFIAFFSVFVIGIILQILCFNIRVSENDPSGKLTYGTRDLALTHPLAVISIITTTATNKRLENTLDKWGDHPLVKDGTFEINVVAYAESDVETSYQIIKVPCEENGKTCGTACSTWQTYMNFVSKETKANWFFRATDAAWINLDNLKTYISRLHKLYDPKVNVVFKGQSDWKGNITSRESGWLVSRAFIHYHLQNNLSLVTLSEQATDATDTSIETSIISKLYSKSAIWDDGYIIDATCNNCQGDALINKQWESFPECKAVEKMKFGTVHDIISIKVSSQPETNAEIAKSITSAPNSLLFSYGPDRDTISLCYSTVHVPKFTYIETELRRKIVFVSIIPSQENE